MEPGVGAPAAVLWGSLILLMAPMRRAVVAALAVAAALLLAPDAALASGTLSVNGAGVVVWLGAQSDRDLILLEMGPTPGSFIFTDDHPGATIIVSNSSGGAIIAASLAANRVQLSPGIGSISQIIFNDLGAPNSIAIQRVTTSVPITIVNSSGVLETDAVVIVNAGTGPLSYALTNTGVSIPTQVEVALDYTFGTRAILSVITGADVDTLTTDYTGSAGGLASVNIDLGAGSNSATFKRTAAGVPIFLNTGIHPLNSVTIGDGGSLSGINGGVNVRSSAGSVALTIDGHLDSGSRTVTVTEDSVAGLAPAVIDYSQAELASLSIIGNNAGNTFTVPSVPVSSPTGAVTTITTGTGADSFTVSGLATGATLSLQAGGGTDTLVVHGTTQSDVLSVAASGANTLVFSGAPTTYDITTLQIEQVELKVGVSDPSVGNDRVTIQGTQSAQAVTIDGGAQNIGVILSDDGSTKAIRGPITIQNSGNGSSIDIVDDTTPSATRVTVTPNMVGAGPMDTIFGSGGSLTFGPAQLMTISTGTGADTVTVTPSATTQFVINGGNPISVPGDVANVLTSGLTNPVFSTIGSGAGFRATGRADVIMRFFETVLADGASANGSLAFSAASYSANESDGTANVAITRSGFTLGAVGATVTPSSGTATSGADFPSTPVVVTFAEGATSATAQIPIANDTLPELAETLVLTLSSPSGGAMLGTQTTATVSIQDDDTIACEPRPSVQSQLTANGTALSVTVIATPLNTQQANAISQLRFGLLTNARVVVNGQTITSPTDVAITPSAAQVTFTVQRVQSGAATTVGLEVEDSCGTWRTFVGGGVEAAF